jgi:hypothetical protein
VGWRRPLHRGHYSQINANLRRCIIASRLLTSINSIWFLADRSLRRAERPANIAVAASIVDRLLSPKRIRAKVHFVSLNLGSSVWVWPEPDWAGRSNAYSSVWLWGHIYRLFMLETLLLNQSIHAVNSVVPKVRVGARPRFEVTAQRVRHYGSRGFPQSERRHDWSPGRSSRMPISADTPIGHPRG